MPTPMQTATSTPRNPRFRRRGRARDGGAVRIVVQSAGSLFPHAQIKRNVRQGLAPIGEVLISLHANEAPIYGLDSVPFLAVSFVHQARKLYAASKSFLERRLARRSCSCCSPCRGRRRACSRAA